MLFRSDYTQIKTKYEQLAEGLEKQYFDNLQTNMTLPLKKLNHNNLKEFLTYLSSYQKIYFDNFISEEFDINIELETELIPYFSSGVENIASFIEKKIKRLNNLPIFVCSKQFFYLCTQLCFFAKNGNKIINNYY